MLKRKKQRIEYIDKYIKLNLELFPFLNIEKLKERINKNFTKISPNILSFLYNGLGQYNIDTGVILISPKLYCGKKKKYKESVIFHEMDHCACTPIEIKKDYLKFKDKYKFIPNFILSEIFNFNYNGKIITGVHEIGKYDENKLSRIITKSNWKKHLNEGITSLKQILYSNKLNIKFHKENDYYSGARLGAECIARVIGFENMIKYHFENDICAIEELFNKRTHIKLKDLMTECLFYDNHRTKKKLKKLKDKITQIDTKIGK